MTKTTLVLVGLLAAGTEWVFAGNHVRPPAEEPVRFAVISDPHLYDARLGTSGSAFEAYLDQDPKLLKESEAILESALSSISEAGVKFLLIPGDLTKDGELADHVLMAQHLEKLRQQGVQVFVVPGNHDINNPDAVAYLANTTRPVPGVTPEVFRAIYQRFGYGQALARDTASLSYVAEPVPGLWLLAIDSCKYQENAAAGTPVVSGRVSAETMTWIQSVLSQAQTGGKQVIAFMHHGVNLHFLGEDVLFPDFLVDDWAQVSSQLAAAGLKVIFTGHYHSQDAAYPLVGGQPVLSLCDVETGSLVQYPCAFRLVSVEGNELQIQSRRVTAAAVDTEGQLFQQFAESFLRARLAGIVTAELMQMFGIPQAQAAAVEPYVTDALVANYAGDESPSAALMAQLYGWVAGPEPLHSLGLMLLGIWTDLPPYGDNQLTLPFSQFSLQQRVSLLRPVPLGPAPAARWVSGF